LLAELVGSTNGNLSDIVSWHYGYGARFSLPPRFRDNSANSDNSDSSDDERDESNAAVFHGRANQNEQNHARNDVSSTDESSSGESSSDESSEGETEHKNAPHENNKYSNCVALLEKTLCCPITQTLLRDPVVVPSGITYSRRPLKRWLRTAHTDPSTRESLTKHQLVPNLAVAALVAAVKRKRAPQVATQTRPQSE